MSTLERRTRANPLRSAWRRDAAALLAGLAGILAMACGGPASVIEAPQVVSAERAGAGAIRVTGHDFAFGVESDEAEAGMLEFLFTNAGAEAHELVVVPMDGRRYGAPVAEVTPIRPGEARLLRLELRPGSYRLVCLLITEAAGSDSHRALGMEAGFEVRP